MTVVEKTSIKQFVDLQAWQKAHHLTLAVYEITNTFPSGEKYGITSQIRRASSSIAANIAEGFSRYHFKDKARFYYQARGSAAETQNFLLLARDLELISVEQCSVLGKRTTEVIQLINGLLRALDKQNHA